MSFASWSGNAGGGSGDVSMLTVAGTTLDGPVTIGIVGSNSIVLPPPNPSPQFSSIVALSANCLGILTAAQGMNVTGAVSIVGAATVSLINSGRSNLLDSMTCTVWYVQNANGDKVQSFTLGRALSHLPVECKTAVAPSFVGDSIASVVGYVLPPMTEIVLAPPPGGGDQYSLQNNTGAQLFIADSQCNWSGNSTWSYLLRRIGMA